MDRRSFINRSFGLSLMGMAAFSGLSACKKVFDYSPAQGAMGSEKRKRNDHFSSIMPELKVSDTANTRIALIADNHKNLDEMDALVNHINQLDPLPDFTVHMGDITDEGLVFEYRSTHDILDKLHMPYFVVLGNHDCLGNGHHLFKDFYGKSDYAFAYGQDYFVFFNDVVWELGNRTPDFAFLEREFKKGMTYRNTYLFSHIPPYTDQFTPAMENRFTELVNQYNVKASIHGHEHRYWEYLYSESGVKFLQVPFTRLEEMLVLDISDKMEISHIRL